MAYKDDAVNWFGQIGHAQDTHSRPQVSAPVLSQIPGLNKMTAASVPTEEPPRQPFRDTDSAYVRLAKQGGRSDLLRMDQDPVARNKTLEPKALPEWLQQDSNNDEISDDLAYLGNGPLNGGRGDHWDSRQNSPPGERYYDCDWSRKTSAEVGRHQILPESQSAYPEKQLENSNWQGDNIQQSHQRASSYMASAGPENGFSQLSSLKSRDNMKPDWLQSSPPADNRKDSYYGEKSPIVKQREENLDMRSSPTRQRYSSGQSSPQKPYADHNYQMPMATETSSAFSRKQLPSPSDRESSSKKSAELYSSADSHHGSSQQLSSTANQQSAGINSMRRADSMSKLLSFGYLRDAENDSLKNRTPARPQKLDISYTPNTYSTEYKEKMLAANSSSAATPFNDAVQPAYVPTLMSDPGHRRRKQSIEERPDFFKIGSSDPQSLPAAFGSRKPSADTRPAIFDSERLLSAASSVTYGKMKHEAESKPDFFKIGSLDNYLDKHVEQQRPDDGGILDKLNGYHGITKKANFRRRKTDFNSPAITTPVKAVSRF